MPGSVPPVGTARSGLLSPVSSSATPIKSILRMSTSPHKPSAASTAAATRRDSKRPLKRKMDDRRYDSDSSDSDEENEDNDGASDTGADADASAGRRKRNSQASSPSSKRQKTVHFDLSLNKTTEVGTRTLDETKRTVRQALEMHAVGDDHEYAELQEVFAHDREAYLSPVSGGDDDSVRPDELVLYVMALTSYTPMLDKSCSSLVQKILSCSWTGRDDTFFHAYVQFLAALVSAQGLYLRPVLEMAVEQFREPHASSWTVPDFPPVHRGTAQKRLHAGLEYILQLFPAARTALGKIVGQKFPFPSDTKSVYLFYLDNVLRLRQYAPNLGPELLEAITSNLVKMDTEFQLDLGDMDDDLVSRVLSRVAEEEEEEEGSRNGNGSKEEDEEADDSDSEADESDLPGFGDPGYDQEAAQVDRSIKLVQKLDAVLDRLFALFDPQFADPMSEVSQQCLGDMLSDFANFVLTVPSSRHTQFLVFHFSQRSLALQDIFTGTLLNLGFESNRPAAVRQAAASYLSSYVARAARVPRETVRSVVGILSHRIEAYRRSNSEGCRGPDLRRYQELYTWVQALLYIFCFRWRDLVDAYPDIVDPEDAASFVGQELEWMPGLKQTLTSVIHSVFNPLMVCSPPIVAEFAKLAHAMRFMYIFPRLESNKSIHLSQFVSGHYGTGEALREDATRTMDDEKRLQLEGNFPFDPYLLPKSKHWLEGDYLRWTPIAGMDDYEGEGGDSDDYDESEDDDENGGGDGPDEFEEDTATDPDLEE